MDLKQTNIQSPDLSSGKILSGRCIFGSLKQHVALCVHQYHTTQVVRYGATADIGSHRGTALTAPDQVASNGILVLTTRLLFRGTLTWPYGQAGRVSLRGH